MGESGWVVVDIDQRDVDRGGSGQTTQLSQHVFSLNDHLVMFTDFTLHVGQSRPDDPWTVAQRYSVGTRLTRPPLLSGIYLYSSLYLIVSPSQRV